MELCVKRKQRIHHYLLINFLDQMMKVFSRASFSFCQHCFLCFFFSSVLFVWQTHSQRTAISSALFILRLSAFSFWPLTVFMKTEFSFSFCCLAKIITKRNGTRRGEEHDAAARLMSTWKVLFVKWLRDQNWTRRLFAVSEKKDRNPIPILPLTCLA